MFLCQNMGTISWPVTTILLVLYQIILVAADYDD